MSDELPWWGDDEGAADTAAPAVVDPEIDRPTLPGPWDEDPGRYWWGRGEDPPRRVEVIAGATAVTASAVTSPGGSRPATEDEAHRGRSAGAAGSDRSERSDDHRDDAVDAVDASDGGRRRRAVTVMWVATAMLVGHLGLLFAAPLVTEWPLDGSDDTVTIGFGDLTGTTDGYAAFWRFEENVAAWILIASVGVVVAVVSGIGALRRRWAVVPMAIGAATALGMHVLIMRPPGPGDRLTLIDLDTLTVYAQASIVLLGAGLAAAFGAVAVRWPGGGTRAVAGVLAAAAVAGGTAIFLWGYTESDLDATRARNDAPYPTMALVECETARPFEHAAGESVALVFVGGPDDLDTSGSAAYTSRSLELAGEAIDDAQFARPTIDGRPVRVRVARPTCPTTGSPVANNLGLDVVAVDLLLDRSNLPLGVSGDRDAAFVFVDGRFVGAGAVDTFDGDALVADLGAIAEASGARFARER